MESEKLKIGDRIMLLGMTGENEIPMGTKGTVYKILQDPFDKDSQIIEVRWDNGASLNLLSNIDDYKILGKK